MDDRLGRFDQAAVVVIVQSELFIGQISAKYSDARFEVIVKTREVQVELQRPPEADLGFMLVASPDQQVELVPVIFEQERSYVRSHISGRTGQEDCHFIFRFPFSIIHYPLSILDLHGLGDDKWQMTNGK